MSDYHVRQLRSVETRMEASRAALTYAVEAVERANNAARLAGRNLEDYRKSLEAVEDIHFVYLFAVFEGILRVHLTQKQPPIRVTRQTKIDRIISLVCRAEDIALDPVLRNWIEAVRDYRNYLANGKQGNVATIPFRNALSALNAFVAPLPDPLR